jgi:hypothetical protein
MVLMRARRLILSVLGVALGVLAFGCSSALALELHAYGSSFGSKGAGAGQFEEPIGVAVSEVGGTAGEVYVVDRAKDRVQIFNSTGTTVLGEFNGTGAPTGTFENPEWVAVDNSASPLDPSAGDVYVTDTGHNVVDKFSPTGTYEGQIKTGAEGVALSEIHGVAVDTAGRVWVYQANGEVDDYSDSLAGELLGSRSSTRGFWAPGFAVDSEDNLYPNWGMTIAKFNSTGSAILEEFDVSEHSTGVAVDTSTNYVYIDKVKGVAVFNTIAGCTAERSCHHAPVGSSVERFGEGQITEEEAQLKEGSGIAVSAATGTVYVADRSADAIRIFPAIFMPDPVTGQATNVHNEGSATLNGTVNPDGEPLTSCRFEYGTTTFYGESVPCQQSPAEIGSGNTPIAVSVDLNGLTPSNRYHYRLVVANANGENQGADNSFTLLALPSVTSESPSSVGSSTATLGAMIGPGGVPASYHVEYGTGEGYGTSTPEVGVGAGLEAGSVRLQLTGLQPSIGYHYRFVAQNALGTSYGEDKTFTTTRSAAVSSPALPDNRMWELVSTGSENGNMYYPIIGFSPSPAETAFQTQMPDRAAPDGESVTYPGDPTHDSGNGAIGAENGNQYLARRSPSGWVATDIAPPSARSELYEYFSEDLSVAELRTINREGIAAASPQSPPGCPGIFSGTGGDGGYHALFTAGQLPPGQFRGGCHGEFGAGSSADGSHLLFEAGGTLDEEVEFGGHKSAGNLYDTVDGQPRMVNVLPDGEPEPIPAATFGGPRFGSEQFQDLSNVISEDGSRVFWSSVEAPKAQQALKPTALYVRENDAQPQSPIGPHGECEDSGDACTVQLDAGEPACVAEGKCESGGGQFWTASSDGSRVFFTDCRRLTADSTAVPGAGCVSTGENERGHLTGNDLYEYNLDSSQLTDLTVDDTDVSGADVQGVIGASRDGSHVYFVAGGALAPGATSRVCAVSQEAAAEEEEKREELVGLLPAHHGCNLYVRHSGVTTFIGVLLAQDNDLQAISGSAIAERGDWRSGLGERTAHVTPDGNALAFISTRRLTGYPSEGVREVFVYDALTGRISCASCDPSGAPPTGGLGGLLEAQGGYLPTSNQPTFTERLVSDDGSRVFFETDQGLVPQDNNGLTDVYEWERNGTGSCGSPAPGGPEPGCIYLLSGGEGFEKTYIADSDASGANVFLVTRDRLTPRANENIAVYDVRVDGGFPDTSLACTGTGCQGVPPAPPIFATPASTTFEGVGNFAAPIKVAVKSRSKPKRCAPGHVRRHGRCVKKRPSKKSKRSKRSKRSGKGRK